MSTADAGLLRRALLNRGALGDTDLFHDNVRRRGVAGQLYLWLFGTPQLGSYANGIYLDRVLARRRFDSVLDAGCGSGAFCFYVAKRFPSTRVLGVDIGEQGLHSSRSTLDICRDTQAELSLPNLEFAQADLRVLERSSEFDFTFSFDVIEHIEDNFAVLEELREALRPGGWLLLRVPTRVQKRILPARYTEAHERWASVEHPGQHHDMASLTADLVRAGFTILESSHTMGFWGRLSFELLELLRYYGLPEPVVFAAIPFLKVLRRIDTMLKPRDGDGLLFLCERPAREQG